MGFFKNLANRTAAGINANADIIMAVGALIGLGCTIVLAIRETPEAERIVYKAKDALDGVRQEAKEKDWTEEEEKRAVLSIRVDTAKSLAFNYLPTLLGLCATGACIIGSNKIVRTRNAALSGSLNAANLVYQEYRDHVRSVVGEKKETEIHDGIRKEHIEHAILPPENTITNTGKGNTLCFIELEPGSTDTGLYFWSSPEAIHAAVNEANAEGLECGCVSFADFLYFNGIKVKGFGTQLRGWTVHSRDDFIRIRESSHVHPSNGLPVLDISFWTPPYYEFDPFA